jgi:hypothetical protein
MAYDISYISKRNNTSLPRNNSYVEMNDTVLKTLKFLVTDLAVQVTTVCKAFKRITLIKKHLSVKGLIQLVVRFADASGCNHITFLNDNSKTIIFQTVLGNLLVFSLPIEIFPPPYYFLNKDISFVKLGRMSTKQKSQQTNLYKTIDKYQSRMFSEGMEVKDYDIFLLNYYSRLSNIDLSKIERWMSKQRAIKAKILATSSFVRDICATTIQRFFLKVRISKAFIMKKLTIFLVQHKKNIDKKISDSLLNLLLENESANIISRFFYKATNKIIRYKKKTDNKQSNTSKLKGTLATKLEILKHIRLGRAPNDQYYGAQTVVHMFDKNRIIIPKKYNTEKRWFGFNRNDSLNNLVLSTGNRVNILDQKTEYTSEEFMDILNCLADICSVTKSCQFIKLCRIFSGVSHKKNTLEDFIGGFCWMFKKPTVLNVLTMAQKFCKCLNKPKWFIYLINNTNKINQTINAMF